jgi:hypothetical protein
MVIAQPHHRQKKVGWPEFWFKYLFILCGRFGQNGKIHEDLAKG